MSNLAPSTLARLMLAGATVLALLSAASTQPLRAAAQTVGTHAASSDGIDPAASVALQATLVASDGTGGDRFGASVALAGSTVVIGAPGAAGTGAVYVFRREGQTWTQVQKLTASDAAGGDEFGASVALATYAGESTVIVGAPGAASSSGAAYFFRRTSDASPFVQQQKVQPAGAVSSGGRFGTSVTIAMAFNAWWGGWVAAVGSPLEGGTVPTGAAYTFRRGSDLTWSQVQRVVGRSFGAGWVIRHFGASVAIDSIGLGVGAPLSRRGDGSLDAAGAVFFFNVCCPGTIPPYNIFFEDGGTETNAKYGSSVAVRNFDFAASHGSEIKAFQSNSSGGWSGTFGVMRSPTWSRATALAMDSATIAASVADGTADIYAGAGNPPAGAARTWQLSERFRPAGSSLAGAENTIAIAGSTYVVGIPQLDGDRGAAYVFVPSAAPPPVVVGFGPGSGGLFQTRGDWESGMAEVSRWPAPAAYNARSGELRPAFGDVDGDGLDEVVLGFGYSGEGTLIVLDDAAHNYARLATIQVPWAPYNSRNGSTWPAVGDIDGDELAEIVVGLGDTADGFFAVFDDHFRGYQLVTWRRVSWPEYNARRGETRPVIANVDGGTRNEIVVGLGSTGLGWMEVFDGAAAGFASRQWIRSSYGYYNMANGETFPAAGDLDGDGLDEIVVGLGRGSDGWVEILDDAVAGFRHRGWLQLGWPGYNADNGEVHPAVGNIDSDAAPEIIFGLGLKSGEGGWMQVLDDAARGHASLGWKNAADSTVYLAGAATYPAIGRRR